MTAKGPANQKASRARRTGRTDWRPTFLRAFETTGTVVQACRAAGIDRRTAYRERQRNEEFALAWADIDEKVTETLERVALQRAIDGSDRLIEFLLRARRPETYRDNVRVEHSGRVQHDLQAMSDEQLDQLAAQLQG